MMKKSVQTLAAGVAISLAPSLAIADVDIYGKANVSFQNSDSGDGSATEVVSNASRIGLKGSESISDELKAIYQFEFQVDVADGDNGGSTFSQRNIFVGLQGDFGTVKLGKFDTPLKTAQKKVDLFNDLEGDIKNIITVNDNRPSNVLAYTSPTGPIVANVAFISSEDSDTDNGISASLTYANDNLYLAAAVDQNVEAEDSDAVRLVAQYSIGDLQLGALVEEYDAGNGAESGYFVSAKYKMDDLALKAQFGASDIDEEGGESLSLGVDYKLAKPVKVYGFITLLDSDEGTDDSHTGIGIEYKF